MKEFVVYYNPDKVGTLEKPNPLSAYSKKAVSQNVVGGRLWLLTGIGSPKQYFLKAWFTIEYVDVDPLRSLKTCVGGSEGKLFEPLIAIDKTEQWFKTFFESQGHFAFGFNSIKESETVEELEKLAGLR